MNCTLTHLHKTFGNTIVLRDVSITLHPSAYALCGASGTGKTTLLRLLCGLEVPDSGSVSVPEKTRFSYAFQEPRLFGELSVLKNIELISPVHPPRILLDELNLLDAADKLPAQLSGGMKKRAALARALAAPADIYLLDEPTAGQDPENSRKILACIQKYTKDALCIAASHDEEFIRGFADVRLTLDNGNLSIL